MSTHTDLSTQTLKNNLLFIECLRGIAAVYIVLHHFAHEILVKQYPKISHLFVFGQFAVLTFFVMSGFVIYYSSFFHNKKLSFRVYFLKRFKRIYPLFLLSLLCAYGISCIIENRLVDVSIKEIFGNLLMLQDYGKKGNWIPPFIDNSPLWSLSYEWFFYMLFFPTYALFAKKEYLQKYFVLSLGLLGYGIYQYWPNQISLFLMYYVIWWSGVELAKEYLSTRRLTWKRQLFSIISVSIITLGWFYIAWTKLPFFLTSSVSHPILELRHFLTAVLILVFGLSWYKFGGIAFWQLMGWGRLFAPISYALYIFHLPILSLWEWLYPMASPFVKFICVMPVILIVAYIAELKIQPIISSPKEMLVKCRRFIVNSNLYSIRNGSSL